MAKPITGWWNPTPYSNRRRIVFHYVGKDGRTLCGKWLYIGIGTVEKGHDDHRDNCAACRKKLSAMAGDRGQPKGKLRT